MTENIPTIPDSWNPVNAFTSCMKRYAQFSGRACRSEYWFYTLAYFILYCVCMAIDLLICMGIPVFQLILMLATLVPSFAVSWRRMHDSGLSGAHSLWVLIPYLGSLVFIILACRSSNAGPNRFGAAPAAPVR